MVEKHRHREFIGYQVYATQRLLARSLELSLASFGLTPSQWNALNQLEDHGAMTQKQLAEMLLREPATIARSVDRLVARGLVTRTQDPHDRRANIVDITPAASALLSEIEPVASERQDALAQGISDEDLDVFFDVLERLQENASTLVDE